MLRLTAQTTSIGGLGIGLSIAQGNAQLLGGKITVKSQKGEGSTFYITIPYLPVD
ncbi:MAG: ATP-binding protein [bacterium]